jgi:hypothetical protein
MTTAPLAVSRHTSWPIARLLVTFAVATGLAIGCAGQPAHAATAETSRFYMDISRPRTSVCLGEFVRYKTTVFGEPATGKPFPIELTGVRVNAFVGDPGIGQFSFADKNGTSTGRTGYNGFLPAHVEFLFHATKAGSTSLYFEGAVKGFDIHVGYVSFTVPIRVIQCQFDVKTTLKFPLNGVDDPVFRRPKVTVLMPLTRITADTDGHFTGEADVQFISGRHSTRFSGLTCTWVETFPKKTSVKITGELLESGQLSLKFFYAKIGSDTSFTCPPAAAIKASGVPYLLDELDVVLPADGGTIHQKQGYNAGKFFGSSTITVRPVQP